MLGGTRLCLLALSLVMLPSGLARAQSAETPLDRISGSALAPPHALPFPELTRQWPGPRPLPSQDPFGLPQLAHAAGMIFSATVTGIARLSSTGGQAIGGVAITFHVENAIRGAAPGDDLNITEWLGLWSSGQRYRVGERVLVFLYPRSKLGLTSSVGGGFGRFHLDSQGRVLFSAQQISAFRRDPVLGGKSRVSFRDFALAVRQATGEEWMSTRRR